MNWIQTTWNPPRVQLQLRAMTGKKAPDQIGSAETNNTLTGGANLLWDFIVHRGSSSSITLLQLPAIPPVKSATFLSDCSPCPLTFWDGTPQFLRNARLKEAQYKKKEDLLPFTQIIQKEHERIGLFFRIKYLEISGIKQKLWLGNRSTHEDLVQPCRISWPWQLTNLATKTCSWRCPGSPSLKGCRLRCLNERTLPPNSPMLLSRW